ncbi:hypothetical protein AB0J74_26315 [Asanoa sp. NPDC049573]|uniref:hypothetical protein n=1 Tax=Asanoa sp. NPDC049573 TaxID=3155396 RepID=UPI00341204BD
MSDDWNWDDGHSGHDMPPDDHDLHHHDDPDPFGSDLPDGLDDHGVFGADPPSHDDLPDLHHEDLGGYEHDGGFDAPDPFAPDALVSEHHDWSAGLDDAGDDSAVHDSGLFAVDPDVAAYTGGVWPVHEFPAALELGDISPVDGPPWTDPSTLGTAPPDPDPLPTDVPDVSELASYAGLDPTSPSAGWDALLGSDDPATSALARFWGRRTP